MAGVNKIILIGNLTADPEIRYVSSGAAVVRMRLAVNGRKNKKSGETPTTYFPIVVWDKLAEIANQYCKKGNLMYFEGRVDIRDYDTKEGEKRRATEVVVSTMQFLTPRPANATNGAPDLGDTFTADEEPEHEDDLEPLPI
jgi:single-strand DNA-binding protein